MKTFIRTLYPKDRYWHDENGRFRIRNLLNNLGFYVVHGQYEDTLDVYVVRPDTFLERWFL